MSDAIKRLRKLRTMVISACEGPWSERYIMLFTMASFFSLKGTGGCTRTS
ncbi:MAG: hypothetical protein ACP5F1_06245 [Thermoplasmata archaeon]